MDRITNPRSIIREHWASLQLTQKEGAQRMGISQSCLNQYLHGKIKLNTDTIIKFASLFNIPPSQIDPRIY